MLGTCRKFLVLLFRRKLNVNRLAVVIACNDYLNLHFGFLTVVKIPNFIQAQRSQNLKDKYAVIFELFAFYKVKNFNILRSIFSSNRDVPRIDVLPYIVYYTLCCYYVHKDYCT